MKKIFLSLVLVAFFLPYFISAATINAATCNLADVQAAIDKASNGDIVKVPAGNCVWGDGRRTTISGQYAYPSISINKSLSLIGSSTHITRSGTGYLILYSPSDFSKNWPLRISGFTFNGGGTSSGIYFASSQTIQDRIRVDHNTFQDFSGQALRINGQRGVADNNIFTGTDYPIRFASGDDYYRWQNWEGIVFGKLGNNFYFEDNVIDFYNTLTDCQYGNRYAFRYNTLRALGPESYPFMEMHGDVGTASGGCAYRSCFGSEIYGNHITHNAGHSDFRGGKYVVFYNFISKPGQNFWGLRDLEGASLGWEACECVYCPSTNPQPQHISDSYAWNNRRGSLSAGTESDFYAEGFSDCTAKCGYVVNENDEYFNFNPLFDGKTGVGCGTIANRPSTCTTGVGYWATTQSCTDLTGLVGDHPAHSISGTLYKCTATNTWTAYFTPLAYPHPLRTDCTKYPMLCDSGSVVPPPACTASDWSYSDGVCQPSNTLVRTWTKIGSCQGGVSHSATETISCVYSPTVVSGDVNSDGRVDISDLSIVALNFGKSSGFDVRANVVKSTPEIIDIADLSFVARRFTG